MAASSETGVDATLRHHGETLGRLEGKVDSNFKWLLCVMLSGFAAIITIIIGAPYLFAPASIIPQHSPGGYTLTVNPDPASGATATPASSN